MQKTRALWIILALTLMIPTWSSPALAKGTPKATLKRLQTRLNGLLRKKAKPGSEADKKLKQKIKGAINDMLDFEELARRSLRKHWGSLTPVERAEFTRLLKDLIECNYIKQLRGNLDFKLSYGNASISGDQAKVLTTVKVEKKRRITEMVIEYKMRKVKNRWMVYDVVTDEVSIVRNYRSQFNRIIRKKSYQALVKKMRKKLKEIS